MKGFKGLSVLLIFGILLGVLAIPASAAGTVLWSDSFSYSDGTKLNTTVASSPWTGGWVANTSNNTLTDDYVVNGGIASCGGQNFSMYRFGNTFNTGGDYDFFIKWDQSLNATTPSGSNRAEIRIKHQYNESTSFGLMAIDGASGNVGKWVPYSVLPNGTYARNTGITFNNNTFYTVVSRLSSRVVTGKYNFAGFVMAYPSGSTQPGNWQVTTTTSQDPNVYTMQAVRFYGTSYGVNGGAKFKGFKIEKFLKSDIEPVETAVNNAISTKTTSDISAARTQVATLMDGIAKDTFTAQLDALQYSSDVATDKSTLDISYASGDSSSSVTQNLTLPTSGSNGTTISWSSSNTLAISNAGSVTRPSCLNGDASVTLTATITKGSASDTKTFAVTVKEKPIGTLILSEPFSYEDGAKLNTTGASGGWTTGWVGNTDVASPTPLPDTYQVTSNTASKLGNQIMFRGIQTTSSASQGIDATTDYDYFFRWNQKLQSAASVAGSHSAYLALVAYNTNRSNTFGFTAPTNNTGYYVPTITMDGAATSTNNANVKFCSNIMYTMVARLSSRQSPRLITGRLMGYPTGTSQPGGWMVQNTTSGLIGWQFQAIGLIGMPYNEAHNTSFGALTVEKYSKAEIDAIDNAVNTALSTKASAEITSAQNIINKMIDGIAKDTYNAQLRTISQPFYLSTPMFSKLIGAEGTNSDTININTILLNNDVAARNVTIIAALYDPSGKMKKAVVTLSDNVSVSSNAYDTNSLSIEVPKVANGYTVKYFAWDTITGLKPLSQPTAKAVAEVQ